MKDLNTAIGLDLDVIGECLQYRKRNAGETDQQYRNAIIVKRTLQLYGANLTDNDCIVTLTGRVTDVCVVEKNGRLSVSFRAGDFGMG